MRKKSPLIKHLAVLGWCTAAALAVACAPQAAEQAPSALQQEQPSIQANEPSSSASESSLSLSDRLFSYKLYGDSVYYRRYQENSFAETGIFQNYAWNNGSDSEIVRLDRDGSSHVLFKDNGYGPVYPLGDRLYLNDAPYYYGAHLYSTSMDGEDRIDYREGQVLASDAKRGLLLCMGIETQESTTSFTFFTIGADGSVATLATLDRQPEAPVYEDGTVYYGLTVPDTEYSGGDATPYLTTFYRLSVDGGTSSELATVKMGAYSPISAQVLRPLDGRLYFSCGGYAGSGNFFQGGIVGFVELADKEITLLADEEHLTIDPQFYLKQREDGGVSVICYGSSQEEGALVEIDTATGDGQKLEIDYHILNEPGTIFWADNKACVYPDASGRPVTIREGLTTEFLGIAEDSEYEIKDMAYLQGCLYYTVVESELWPDANMGWRTGYRRVSGRAYRLPDGEKQAQLLYDY